MWNAKTNRLGDRWMIQQDLVDFSWPDLFSAANDQLLKSAGQREITIVVEEPLVAGAEPPVRIRLGVGFRIVLIAGHHVRTLDHHLSALAGREEIPRIVHDADLDA